MVYLVTIDLPVLIAGFVISFTRGEPDAALWEQIPKGLPVIAGQ